MSAFAKFAAVGTVGFVVNAAAYWIGFNLLNLGDHGSWLFAFVPAVTFTWWGNRTFTFHEHASRGAGAMFKEWARFVLTNGFGALVNYATYALLIHFAVNRYGALAAGVLAGLAFNFTLSKRMVFRSRAQ